MKYTYGPVPSRRLGQSLGIDPIPTKTCNYNCIYCQLGRTTNFTNIRKNYYPKEEILTEIREAIQENEKKLDYITFVGSGEPTLYKDLKDLIIEIKKISEKPVCVITNGSLLFNKDVQEALLLTDAILPSLDAGNEKAFIRINRPHPEIKFKLMTKGLIEFREKFNGKFWVEIMLMKNINDSKEELLDIKEQLDRINPDRIDINVPIRPPAEEWVEIPEENILILLNEMFKDYNDINFPEMGHFGTHSKNFISEILKIVERHPMREEQIIETFSTREFPKSLILNQLKQLEEAKKIKKIMYTDKIFWKLADN